MRRLMTAGVGLALMVLIVGTAAASHSWGSYHWARSQNPLQLTIGSNVGSAYTGRLATAVSDWSARYNPYPQVLDLTVTTGAGLKNCGPVAGRVEVCDDRYGYRQGGWLGIAQIWASGDHITQATVKLNDTFLLGGGLYDSDAWRQMVTCQEVGHTFGLDHQDENFDNPNLGTCMDYTSDPAGPPSNEHPDKHDYEELAIIYEHLDTSGGGGGGGGNCPSHNKHCSGADVGNAPPFSQASRANGSLYVDHLPGGVTRITHVLWTLAGR
jgi:hypothetical protein